MPLSSACEHLISANPLFLSATVFPYPLMAPIQLGLETLTFSCAFAISMRLAIKGPFLVKALLPGLLTGGLGGGRDAVQMPLNRGVDMQDGV